VTGWIAAHADVLQVLTSVLLALVWIIYLQTFLVGFHRQRRTTLLVNTGVGVGMRARCFVSNLGFEPVYLMQVMVRLRTAEREETAVITDRTEMTEEQLRDPGEATNQGPLKSGEMSDIGDFHGLFTRASDQVEAAMTPANVAEFEIVIAATSAANSAVVGASRRFRLVSGSDGLIVQPLTLSTRQIRGRLERRRLRRELEARLDRVPG